MEIRTERLLLREFVADDWEAVLRYQRDARYLRYYPWENRGEKDARGFVQMFLGQQQQNPRRRFQLAITLPGTHELIGNCGVRMADDSDHEADIGYELSHEWWGHGYATEGSAAMVDFGFRELGVHRVVARCVADNAASVRVLQRLGFREEGRYREAAYFKGRYWDTLTFAILDREWADRR
jgi:RimJ/RimL family protein N-acetyltransferase